MTTFCHEYDSGYGILKFVEIGQDLPKLLPRFNRPSCTGMAVKLQVLFHIVVENINNEAVRASVSAVLMLKLYRREEKTRLMYSCLLVYVHIYVSLFHYHCNICGISELTKHFCS